MILGGTTEASALCKAVHLEGLQATLSLAGRVERPIQTPIPMRIGGFGGAEGLVDYVNSQSITHIVDATHPFAAQMSANACRASAETGVPLVAMSRPPWDEQSGDNWHRVPDIAAANDWLNGATRRVMLAVGRMHLDAFLPNAQNFYLLRLVDPPKEPLKFPQHHIIVSRGPFLAKDDCKLMQEFEIELVVSKNSGGTGAYSKIEAARKLGLPVLIIDRPSLHYREEVRTVAEVLSWIHDVTERGV